MLRIHCLGQFSVQRDGQLLGGAAAQPKRLAILALLACAGDRGLTRERLIGLLWSDIDIERARRLVSQAIWALRRDLGGDDVIDGQRDLRFNPDRVASDVVEFRAAVAARAYETAASLYGGGFLEGFHLSGASEFDRWLDGERTALAHAYAEALERCATAEAARGNHPTALVWWRKLAAHDPLNTRTAMQLMQALVATGDRSGAIRHAEIHGTLMKHELDLPPDPTVEALARELRRAPTPIPDVIFQPITTSVRAESDMPPSGQGNIAAPPLAVSHARGRRWLLAPMAALVAVVALVIVRRTEPRPGDAMRVAVAPLENRTSDSTLDPIGSMVAEWITNGLASTGLVAVVDARTMLDAIRGTELPAGPPFLRTVAERTRAGLMVSGSFYRDVDSLLMQLEITRARTGELVRSIDPVKVPVARPTEALEPLRQRVTGAFAVLLDNRLNNWTAVTSQPPTFEAYQEFVIGMDLFGVDYPAAIEHFTRAAAHDSTYWQAMLWAGVSYSNLRDYPPADSLFKILTQHRAQLAPYDQANLDYFYGGFVLGDWERSYRGARRMAQLAPEAAHALFGLGLTAVITNRPSEAVDLLPRIDTDEGWGKGWSLRIWNVVTAAHHLLGRHDAELRVARHMREQEPNAGWTRFHEIRALIGLGQSSEAMTRADEAAAFPPTPATWEPFSPGDLLYQTGRELRSHGHPDLAMPFFEQAAQWFADHPSEPGAAQALADAWYALERWDAAAAYYDSLARLDPSNVALLGSVGATAQRRGDTVTADSALRRLEAERRPYLFGSPRYQAARIVALRGQRDRAVGLLRQARREGSARIQLFHLERDFEPLRDYPPFRDILQPRSPTPR